MVKTFEINGNGNNEHGDRYNVIIHDSDNDVIYQHL